MEFKNAGTTFFASPERSSQDEIVSQNAFLSRRESLFQILDAMPELVFIANNNRQIVFANTALINFVKAKSANAIIGKRPGELFLCQQALSAPSGCGTGEGCRYCGANQVMLGVLEGKPLNSECRILSQTDLGMVPYDLRIWGTPFVHEGQKFILSVATDITNEKRRQVLEKIFFHDVINTAGGIAGLLDQVSEKEAEFEDVIELLLKSSKTLLEEIKNQKNLVAAENNELKVNLSKLKSTEILEWVASFYQNHPVAKNKTIHLAKNTVELFFTSDEILIKRILGNLAKNALEASNNGESVTLGCHRNNNEVTFWCHNKGVIPRSAQLQIFLRSFSTKGEGRGIGTYSVKLLSEKYLRGKTSFVSSEETDTIFSVIFPLEQESENDSK
ncbi:MAG: ATP-binding protein [Candidatus Riflebacteria bacterium]|nr:ATP-binding protein [Candidatus Riflebacteria bacterium]